MTIAEDRDMFEPGLPATFDRKHRIGPLHAVAASPSEAARSVCDLAMSRRSTGSHIHLINAYTVALADKDADYAKVMQSDSINFPDGKPLSWVSRARRDPTPLSQVRGHQLFQDVFDTGRERGLKHYLLGSTDEVLGKMRVALERKFPGVEIVGSYSPPFRALEEAEVSSQDDHIRSSGAHVVWVGLGTPKQDVESRRLAEQLPVVAIAVGAAFDFTAGTVKEAPSLLVTLGLEWAYRFATEPRRLWRRYVFGNFRFLASVVRQKQPAKFPTASVNNRDEATCSE